MIKKLQYKHLIKKARFLDEVGEVKKSFALYMRVVNQTAQTRYWTKYGLKAYLAVADMSLENGDICQAYTIYQEIVEECTDNAYVYLKLGKLARKLNYHHQAVEYLMQAYMLDGESIFKEENEELIYLKRHINL